MSGRSQTPKVTLTILVTYVQSSRVCRGRTRGCQGLGTRKENDCLTGRGFPLGATEVLELSVNELYTCIHLSSVLEGWHVKGPGVQTQQGREKQDKRKFYVYLFLYMKERDKAGTHSIRRGLQMGEQ